MEALLIILAIGLLLDGLVTLFGADTYDSEDWTTHRPV
jgi:hypothetical protein